MPRFNPLSPATTKILAPVCNAVTRHTIKLEGYPNHPRIQQVFFLKSKKKRFWFSVYGSLWGPLQVEVFLFFWPSLPGPGPQSIGPLFWLNIFLETRPISASLEPLNDFLAYLERKIWLINQKLIKILLPQKPLWGAFHSMQ